MDCEFLNVDANLEKAEKRIREAKANGADMVCLPEAFNTGYYCFNYPAMCELAEPLDGKSITAMRKLARELDVPVIIHCENDTNTNYSLSKLAKDNGLAPEMVIKHSSPPLVMDDENFGVMPSIPASKTYIKDALSTGIDRFMIETDYIDDPGKPTAIMACSTVPKKVKWMLASGIATEENIQRICADLPARYYHR